MLDARAPLPLDDAVVIADGALSRQQEGARLDYSEVQDALLSSPRKVLQRRARWHG